LRNIFRENLKGCEDSKKEYLSWPVPARSLFFFLLLTSGICCSVFSADFIFSMLKPFYIPKVKNRTFAYPV